MNRDTEVVEGSTISGTTVTTSNNFQNGDPVTYHAPGATATFTTMLVDAELANVFTGALATDLINGGTDKVIRTQDNDTIYIAYDRDGNGIDRRDPVDDRYRRRDQVLQRRPTRPRRRRQPHQRQRPITSSGSGSSTAATGRSGSPRRGPAPARRPLTATRPECRVIQSASPRTTTSAPTPAPTRIRSRRPGSSSCRTSPPAAARSRAPRREACSTSWSATPTRRSALSTAASTSCRMRRAAASGSRTASATTSRSTTTRRSRPAARTPSATRA